MFQQTIVVGNVGRDVELRYTPQGVAVANFSVAVTRKWKVDKEKREETTWFNVVVWRERAETANEYIKKGMKIMVIGEIKAGAYVDKGGKPIGTLELTASDFKFLDSKPKDEDKSEPIDEIEGTADIPF